MTLSYTRELVQILPAFVSRVTCVELFHSLLDLPLLTAALIRIRVDGLQSTVFLPIFIGRGCLKIFIE